MSDVFSQYLETPESGYRITRIRKKSEEVAHLLGLEPILTRQETVNLRNPEGYPISVTETFVIATERVTELNDLNAALENIHINLDANILSIYPSLLGIFKKRMQVMFLIKEYLKETGISENLYDIRNQRPNWKEIFKSLKLYLQTHTDYQNFKLRAEDIAEVLDYPIDQQNFYQLLNNLVNGDILAIPVSLACKVNENADATNTHFSNGQLLEEKELNPESIVDPEIVYTTEEEVGNLSISLAIPDSSLVFRQISSQKNFFSPEGRDVRPFQKNCAFNQIIETLYEMHINKSIAHGNLYYGLALFYKGLDTTRPQDILVQFQNMSRLTVLEGKEDTDQYKKAKADYAVNLLKDLDSLLKLVQTINNISLMDYSEKRNARNIILWYLEELTEHLKSLQIDLNFGYRQLSGGINFRQTMIALRKFFDDNYLPNET